MPPSTTSGSSSLPPPPRVLDDLRAENGRLAGACPIEICGRDADGKVPTTFTYHTGGLFRVELLAPR
jgi:hypothetical protein